MGERGQALVLEVHAHRPAEGDDHAHLAVAIAVEVHRTVRAVGGPDDQQADALLPNVDLHPRGTDLVGVDGERARQHETEAREHAEKNVQGRRPGPPPLRASRDGLTASSEAQK